MGLDHYIEAGMSHIKVTSPFKISLELWDRINKQLTGHNVLMTNLSIYSKEQ
jgi:hypothetical protein